MKGNYAGAIMGFPLERLVGEAILTRLVRLKAEELVLAPRIGPPSLAPKGRRLLHLWMDPSPAGE